MNTWNELKYEVEGEDRKRMVQIIEQIIRAKAVYLRTPTCSYDIGAFNVGRHGELTWTEDARPDDINQVVAGLAHEGFEPKSREQGKKPEKKAKKEETTPTAEPEKPIEQNAPVTVNESDAAGKLTIELPKDCLPDTALANLDRLIEGKGNLIRKAIGADDLSYEITEDRVRFPWFRLTGDADEAAAYTQFIAKLAEQARTAKRVTLKEKIVDNEKYVSYKGLWKLLIDKNKKKTDLIDDIGISSSTLAKMSRGEIVSLLNAVFLRCLEAKKPCTCRYIREQLKFECPEEGCGVKAPIVFALYTKQEQMDQLLAKEKLTAEEVYEPYLLQLAAYAKDNLPAEYGRLKLMVRRTGIGLRDFERAVRSEAEKMHVQAEISDFEVEPKEINLDGIDLKGAMEPRGYRISLEDGVNSIYYENGIAVPVCLCHEPVVITRRLENIDTGQEKLALSHFRNHRWKELNAPRSVVFNKNRLVNLSDSGLPVSTDNSEGMVRYLTAYEAENSKVIPFVRSISRIGWVGNEFYPCAVQGEFIYEGEDADNLVSAIAEKGDYELWLRTAEELRKNPFARIILAASFASPLLELLQNRVIILHIWHASRSGK